MSPIFSVGATNTQFKPLLSFFVLILKYFQTKLLKLQTQVPLQVSQ